MLLIFKKIKRLIMKTWKITARFLCRKPDMVVKDPPDGGTLGMQIVLYPKMEVKMVGGGFPVSDPFAPYTFKVKKTAGFIAVYGIVGGGALYPSTPNQVYTSTVSEWLGGGGVYPRNEDSATPMADASIPYTIFRNVGTGKKLVWGPNLSSSFMAQFQDNKGNVCRVHPLIVLDAGYNVCLDYLIPDIQVELVSSDNNYATLRVTRSHVVPAGSEFSAISMSWYDDLSTLPPGIGDTYADPADPLNDNKLMVLCKAGTYKFGVLGNYAATPRDWPLTHAQCVVEVK